MSWLLARQVGLPNALQLLLDPEVRSGTEVAELGWAQRTPAPGSVLADAVTYASRLAHGSSPQSLATMKRAVVIDAAGDLDTAYRRSVEDMEAALRHPDLRRGLAAQRAKRVPDFLVDGDRPSRHDVDDGLRGGRTAQQVLETRLEVTPPQVLRLARGTDGDEVDQPLVGLVGIHVVAARWPARPRGSGRPGPPGGR